MTELNSHKPINEALSLRKTPLISSELKSIILGLESHSAHPIALAIREVWGQIKPAVIHSLTEIPGIGVQGEIENNFYEFKKTDPSTAVYKSATLYKNGAKILTLEFTNSTISLLL